MDTDTLLTLTYTVTQRLSLTQSAGELAKTLGVTQEQLAELVENGGADFDLHGDAYDRVTAECCLEDDDVTVDSIEE